MVDDESTITLRIMTDEEVEERIIQLEHAIDMNSEELLSRLAKGTAPDSFEAKLLAALLKVR